MQDKLKHAFKETPERFRTAIDSAVREAEQTSPAKRRLSGSGRIALAVILILALIPAAVFGASKIIESMNAEKYKNYGVKITATADPDAEFPEYVKMTVKTPEGFGIVPNTDGRKFYKLSTEQPYTDGFSVDAFRPNPNGIADIADYADRSEKVTVAGHTAYKIIPLENQRAWDRIYVYYEDMNVMLLIYYKGVTDDQLTDFIEGIHITEGTAADHTDIGSYEVVGSDETPNGQVYLPENEYIEKPLDTEFSFASHDENGVFVNQPVIACKVTDVRAADNISGLDTDGFNDLYPLDSITDSSGKLLPHTRELWDFGDGINTSDKLLDSAEVDQKLLLVDFEYVNLSDEDRQVYIPWDLRAMIRDDNGDFRPAEIFDQDEEIAYSEYCSSEAFYLSPHGEGKAFYAVPLKAGETQIVTVGYFVDADKLDMLYLMECPSGDSVYSPDYDACNPNTYFLLKVWNDD